jgi:hypothetical protein
MVWPPWHCIGCGIPRWTWNVLKKWVEDKRNERVLRQANNKAPITKNKAPIVKPT